MKEYIIMLITAVITGIIMATMGIYAIVAIYGWTTLILMFIIGGLIQWWNFHLLMKADPDPASLSASVERAKHGE